MSAFDRRWADLKARQAKLDRFFRWVVLPVNIVCGAVILFAVFAWIMVAVTR